MTREYLTECGVHYLHLRPTEQPPSTDIVFEYNWHHVPTGKTGTSRMSIFAGSMKEAHRSALVLMGHWNRTDEWKYTLKA